MITTIMAIITTMITNSAALYRLMAWLSPSYPVGAFSYSHGIEWLVESGAVHDAASLTQWVSDLLILGSGRNDAILLAEAWRAHGDLERLHMVAEHAAALSTSSERALETEAQGQAFCDVTCRTWGSAALTLLEQTHPHPICYPVAVGVAAADHDIALAPALRAYLHGFAANLVSAGVRLVPLGHSDGQRVLIGLEEAVERTAQAAQSATLDHLSSILVMADIAAMRHETQYTRLFRS